MAVDLFSGAGGLSLGFEQAGFDVLAAVEYDPIAAAVHKFNFPRTEIVCADAAAIQKKTIVDAARAGWRRHHAEAHWDDIIDVVIGGPPCQGFSLIGKRAYDDPRNQLVREFAHLVGKLKPRYFVMENVPGMTSVKASEAKDASRLLDVLRDDFESYGYEVLDQKVLNAHDFGVPQDRQRVILVGHLKPENAPTLPFEETRGRTRKGEPRRVPKEKLARPLCPTVWDAIGDLPNLNDYPEFLESDEMELGQELVAAMDNTASAYARILRGLDRDPADYSHPRIWNRETLTSSLRTTHEDEVEKRFAATNPGHTEATSRFFRLHANGACSTLRAGTHYERGSFNAPRPIHPRHARVISVREAARLHSYPDWFRFNWTKWHGFREIGNSLPPHVGRAVGAEIIKALGITPKKPSKKIPLGDRDLLYMDNSQAIEHFDADPSRAPQHAHRWRKRRSKAMQPGVAGTGAKSGTAKSTMAARPRKA